jgi:hypothetical protein
LLFRFISIFYSVNNEKLYEYDIETDIVDPWANKEEVKHEYKLTVFNTVPPGKKYHGILREVSTYYLPTFYPSGISFLSPLGTKYR